ncbi:hypothetical protein HDU96_008877 [Phlyctochytrium bullatum]|nr:hypothetical protein HDU96_008877 [Phlyctochytrium bullatum]
MANVGKCIQYTFAQIDTVVTRVDATPNFAALERDCALRGYAGYGFFYENFDDVNANPNRPRWNGRCLTKSNLDMVVPVPVDPNQFCQPCGTNKRCGYGWMGGLTFHVYAITTPVPVPSSTVVRPPTPTPTPSPVAPPNVNKCVQYTYAQVDQWERIDRTPDFPALERECGRRGFPGYGYFYENYDDVNASPTRPRWHGRCLSAANLNMPVTAPVDPNQFCQACGTGTGVNARRCGYGWMGGLTFNVYAVNPALIVPPNVGKCVQYTYAQVDQWERIDATPQFAALERDCGLKGFPGYGYFYENYDDVNASPTRPRWHGRCLSTANLNMPVTVPVDPNQFCQACGTGTGVNARRCGYGWMGGLTFNVYQTNSTLIRGPVKRR